MDPLSLLSFIVARLGWAVLHSLWQGAVVAALLVIALTALRHRSAAARHAACLIALAVLLACFVGTVAVTLRTVSAPAERQRSGSLQEGSVTRRSPAAVLLAEPPVIGAAHDRAVDPLFSAKQNENVANAFSAAWRGRAAGARPPGGGER